MKTPPFDPYLEEDHNERISALRCRAAQTSYNECFDALEDARLAKLTHFAVSPQEMADWLSDINRLDLGARPTRLLRFYRHIVADYPVVQYWVPLLEVAIEVSEVRENEAEVGGNEAGGNGVAEGKSDSLVATALPPPSPSSPPSPLPPPLKQLFTDALRDTSHDYFNAHRVWDLVLHHMEPREPVETLTRLHLKRLSYPHARLQDSFDAFSQFVSRHYPHDYERHMLAGNRIFQKSLQQARYYDLHEQHVRLLPADPGAWIDYCRQVSKYAAGDTAPAAAVFARATVACGDIALWLNYVYIVYEEACPAEALEAFLARFVRHFPRSSLSYAEYARNCAEFSDGLAKFERIRDRAEHQGLALSDTYENWKIYAMAVLAYEVAVARAAASEGDLAVVDLLYADIERFSDVATANNDGFHAVEKMAMAILEELGDLENARRVVSKMVQRFGDQSEVWFLACDFERRHGGGATAVCALLDAAVANAVHLDWPERVIQEWLRVKQLSGDLAEYKRSLLQANKVYTLVGVARMQAGEAPASPLTGAKRRAPEAPQPAAKRLHPPRDREHLTVAVNNLPPDVTEATLTHFFADCGEPRAVAIRESLATVEFGDEAAMLAALTKTLKPLDGYRVEVARRATATVWATNYPPSTLHELLERLFALAGRVVSTRFPSLKFNHHRRFCYVEYATAEEAARAVAQLNGHELAENGRPYRLTVKILRPEERQPRRCQVFVQNLDFGVTSVALTRVFAQFGDVDSVVLPAGDKRPNRGYGFVTFKSAEAAYNALKLEGEIVEGRPIKVSLAAAPAAKLDRDKTISVLFDDDTIGRGQVQSFAAAVGAVARVELHPGRGALVEFNLVADAGRAAMVLTGRRLDGAAVTIGPYEEMGSQASAGAHPPPRATAMVPAAVAKRKKRVGT